VRAQLGAEADHAPHVVVGQVAEDPAHQHQVGRDQAGVLVGQRGIGGHHLDPRQARGLGGLARHGRAARVELDQAGHHVGAAGMAGQRADQVAALARAQADRVQRARRRCVQRHPDLVLDRRQALGERGAGLVVAAVPGLPVPLGHTTHATGVTDDDVRTGPGRAWMKSCRRGPSPDNFLRFGWLAERKIN
jgi:hypothetical protein